MLLVGYRYVHGGHICDVSMGECVTPTFITNLRVIVTQSLLFEANYDGVRQAYGEASTYVTNMQI